MNSIKYICKSPYILLLIASKVLLEVLRQRLSYYTTPEIADEQFGFTKGKGTTDAIVALRNIVEKANSQQNEELWLLFIDYSKAFDTIIHKKLW